MAVVVEVKDGQVQAALSGLLKATSDLTAPLNRVGAAWAGRVQTHFLAGTDPYGAPWQPTLRGGQVLVDTGRLRSSIAFQAAPDALAVGTNVIYAKVHQFGATIVAKAAKFLRFKIGSKWVMKKSVTIPARPFLPVQGLPDGYKKDAVVILAKALDDAATIAGGPQ